MDIADAFAKAAEKAENKELLEQVKKAAKEKDREADKKAKNVIINEEESSYKKNKKGTFKKPKLQLHSCYVRHSDHGDAIAPYNFVPFTKTVLPSPLDRLRGLDEADRQLGLRDYITKQTTYSGTIQLGITNITPLFIGNGEDGVNNKRNVQEFFAPNGKPVIPGSSLRGMVRSLFKIVTAGVIRRDEDFTDRHLYFRCIMAPNDSPWLKELYAYYASRMLSDETWENGIPKKSNYPGFLFQRENDSTYYIAPCKWGSVKMQDFTYNCHAKSRVYWNEQQKKAYIWTEYAKNKPIVRFLYQPDWERALEVPQKVIKEYQSDSKRGGVDLLPNNGKSGADAKNFNGKSGADAKNFFNRDELTYLVPCFYTLTDGKVDSFGHGRSYRIPYRHTVGDRLPKVLQDNADVIDFTDAVFGSKDLWAGRVSFEDAILKGISQFEAADYIAPLMGANPTAYQLYLTQKDWPAAHWDSDAPVEVRGYKMYWHKDKYDWRASEEQKKKDIDTLSKKIHPLSPNNQFSGKIHFYDLTAIELGALLKVFSLGDGSQDIVYKLGMGKSMGLGSIRIKATLSLDQGDRYVSLFDANGWRDSAVDTDTGSFISQFEDYVKKKLDKNVESYEKSQSVLATMLDWKLTNKKNWNERVETAGGKVAEIHGGVAQQFVERRNLPTAEEVARK